MARRLLLDARGLIELGWTQGADARAEGGGDVPAWAQEAIAWSLLGALAASLARLEDGDRPVVEHLARVCVALARLVDTDSLEAWNDEPARTQEDVLRLLAAAPDELPAAAYVISEN